MTGDGSGNESPDVREMAARTAATKGAAYELPREKQSPPPDDKTAKKLEDALYDRFMGTLREIRAEVQNLRVSFAALGEAATAKSDEREKKLAVAWSENKEIIDAGTGSVGTLFGKFPGQIYVQEPGGASIYDYYCDDVTKINKKWDRFFGLWEKYGKSAEDISDHIGDLDTLLCGMIYQINVLTIPDRVNEHFKTLYPGQELDFDKNFGDELCKKEHALLILEDINAHPECVQGIVDTAKGKIYKVDNRVWRKLFSFVMAGVLCAAGFGVAFLLPAMLVAAHYPLSITIPAMNVSGVSTATADFAVAGSFDPVALGYVFCTGLFLVIFGGLAHLLIGGVKQARSAEAGSILAIEGWIRWFHIKEIQNCGAVLALIFGFLGMIFLLKTADYATAFFIGYSIDSFVDLFLARFDITVSAKTAEIKKLVPGETGGSAT